MALLLTTYKVTQGGDWGAIVRMRSFLSFQPNLTIRLSPDYAKNSLVFMVEHIVKHGT